MQHLVQRTKPQPRGQPLVGHARRMERAAHNVAASFGRDEHGRIALEGTATRCKRSRVRWLGMHPWCSCTQSKSERTSSSEAVSHATSKTRALRCSADSSGAIA